MDRVNTVIEMPDFSEFPVSHLNENLYHGYVLGQYDVLGDRILSDHIGYTVSDLGRFSSLEIRLPGLVSKELSHWDATLLFVDPCE